MRTCSGTSRPPSASADRSSTRRANTSTARPPTTTERWGKPCTSSNGEPMIRNVALDVAREDGTTVGRYRWFVCGLLFFATTVNYIDRQILSLLKPILDSELGWTNEQFGMVNAAFQAAYAIGLFAFGAFIDRVGTKIGYAVSIAAWSIAAMSHALVGSVGGFFAARVALGLGEGGNFPSGVKAVAVWFPKRERAYATALFIAGSNVGAIIAPAVVPWLAFPFGWRSAFVAAGIAGFAWLVPWLTRYDAPERVPSLTAGELAHIRSDGTAEHEDGAKMGALAILRHREAWSFIVAKFLD